MPGLKHKPKVQTPVQYHEAHFNSDTESLKEGKGQSFALAHCNPTPAVLNSPSVESDTVTVHLLASTPLQCSM